MAANRAPLREEDIRERVNLEYQNLADVRSLSLPGTYHEKIIHLGNSLKNFIRLKSLDLSRNALTTLEGLQHLAYLEKLNLYFNRISALSEVFRLHSLTALKDVDLRLNPVVKNESDYRLFVVHMLPNLRRLDDRPVRDSERKASLLHFTTDHAYELKKSSFVAKAAEPGSSSHPRVAYISSMSKKCIVMDDDDEAVLNLIANCEWDLRNSPGVTGSTQRNPSVEFHSLNSICKMEDKTSRCRKLATQFASLEKWKQENLSKGASSANRYMLLKVPVTSKEMNEAVVYSEKKTRCNQKEPEEHGQNSKGEPQEATQLASEVLYEATPLERLLDLVDKYWNGSKSLHRNRKFLSQAEMILSAIQESMPTEQQKASSSHPELDNLLLEKKALEKCLSVQEKQFTAKIKDMESELNSTKNYMDVFKQRLDQVLEENTVLKACTSKQEQNDQNTANLAQLQIVELQNLNKLLTTENASLQQRLQHFDKMQDLTVMLQESHRTLVSTNQRLLQELDETRARQKAEVEQLHWNYDQLKKSMSKLSFSDMNDSRS
ncbi:centrosomal protein of 72 kDa isoform X4 [Tiliqua scincoides]|uniref:centrosomal protein of 72 kDa isoform X4 n=1 Tax=Tiliqua scincoides TaxID=71010 RepID=UPI003462E9E4